MMSSFFRCLILCLILNAASLLAQAPASATTDAAASPSGATPASKKAKEGYLRFWNMLPKQTGEISLIHDTGAANPTALLSAAPNNYYASYIATKPGHYLLKVVRAAEPKTPLKTFDLILRPDVYVTFYAHVVDGALTIEMLDDTYDRKKADTGSLTIRHLFPGVKVTVKTNSNSASPLMEYGQVEKLEGLPLKPVFLQMEASMPNGQTKRWATEVDFAGCRHASLLLIQDPYGRFRPRVSPDGQPEFTEPAE